MHKKNLSAIMAENKTLLKIIVVGLFLLELQIFAVAAGKSGKETWVNIFNANGNMVHQVRGGKLDAADRDYVEKTFGPLDQLDVRLITTDAPFPFRAWFVAAVGIPVAVILLFSFIVRAYAALFYEDAGTGQYAGEKSEFGAPDTLLDKVIARISRYNVYTIGFLIFMTVFAYWVVPDFISFMGRLGLETLIRFKWFFIAAAVVFLGLVVWIIYLRYLLAKRAMDTQMETEKYRLELEYGQRPASSMRIGYDVENHSGPGVIPKHTGQERH